MNETLKLHETSRSIEFTLRSITKFPIKKNFAGLFTSDLIREYPVTAICTAIAIRYNEINKEIIEKFIDEILFFEKKTLEEIGQKDANLMLEGLIQLEEQLR